MQVLGVSLADPEDAAQRIRGALARDTAIDGMLMLGPGGAAPALAALREADRLGRIAVGTFDLTPEVLAAVRDGQLLFAIDQQPYLQGYLAVVLLTKYLETKAMPGGGADHPHRPQLRHEGERGRRDRSGGARRSMRRASR